MATEVPCGWCNGTGRRIKYEPWEYPHIVHAQDVEYAERVGHELVSLDVEGSYPESIVLGTIYHGESPLEAVERRLSMWSMRGNDIPTSPFNDNGGAYRPVDPRFYEATDAT